MVKAFLQNVLGLTFEKIPEKVTVLTPEIQTLINKRDEARRMKDWKTADKLRDQLVELGVNVQDKKL